MRRGARSLTSACGRRTGLRPRRARRTPRKRRSTSRRSGSRRSLTAATRSTSWSWTSPDRQVPPARAQPDALRGGHQAPPRPGVPGERKQGLARGVRRVRQGRQDQPPELEGTSCAPTMSSSMTSSRTARSSRSTRATSIGSSSPSGRSPATRLCHASNTRPANDVFRLLATRRSSRPARHLRNASAQPELRQIRPGERAEAITSPP